MKPGLLSDKHLVVNILSNAFDQNRSVNYVVKQDRRRKDRIKRLMDYSFKICYPFGEVWLSDDKQACALVLLPDKKQSSIRTIMWDMKLALSVIGLNRVFAVLQRENLVKSFHPHDSICYLWFIGVNPPQQQKGIGSAFMKEVVEECNRKNRPIYLETSVDRNLPWYQKFGIEVYHSVNISYPLYLLRNDKA